jgi:D-alanyl-D-alanine carboxypeptidase/D-alanyl-D-alanine-endopeptidase (penicillin-binding protein 4)
MKFRLFAVVVLLAIAPLVRADLAGDIKAVLQDKYFNKADVGISIVRLGSSAADSSPVFRNDSDIPLMPASNLKLLTTSAALDRFGSEFKFKTVLLKHEQDLYLVGDGDPTLGDVELIKKSGWDANTVFKNWATELKKRGITSVRNVCVDDSVFDEVFVHPNWSPKYASARYSAQVGGVNLNANCADFFIKVSGRGQVVSYTIDPPTRYLNVRNSCMGGTHNAVALGRVPGKNEIVLSGECAASSTEPISVTVHDPSLFAATVLEETLASEGIRVSGTVQRDRTAREHATTAPSGGGGWSLVAALETPISTVLGRANKDSMNLYAESLCKRLGHAVANEPGSWANGTAAVGEFLKRIGIAPNEFNLDDGCGLSRKNGVSAGAMTSLLTYNYFSKNKQAFVDSLGIAGVDGTLEHRFKTPAMADLRQRVFAKSGYIDGVSALSGYLKSKDNQWYAFSILMNNLPGGTNPTAKTMQERMVRAVDQAAGK